MSGCRSDRRRAHLSPRWNRSTPRPSRDEGSASVELVLLAPFLVMLLLFTIYAGRVTQAGARVRHAADQAARAASLSSSTNAASAATEMAAAELSGGGIVCESMSTAMSSSSFGRTRTVTVTVTCSVSREGLAPLLPGSTTLRASSTEVIDRYRADS
ncbi:MAG: pilus assembly protein [Ilumatobacteraceae bacterium]